MDLYCCVHDIYVAAECLNGLNFFYTVNTCTVCVDSHEFEDVQPD